MESILCDREEFNIEHVLHVKTRFNLPLSARALLGYLVEVFSGPSCLSLFGADSLSRSDHCAPDENDRPSEQTKIFKLTSVYVPVYISELTRT